MEENSICLEFLQHVVSDNGFSIKNSLCVKHTKNQESGTQSGEKENSSCKMDWMSDLTHKAFEVSPINVSR